MQSSITDNSSLNTGGIARVVGAFNGTPTMANYANANMTVRGSKVTSGTGEVTQHGADCTTATTGPTGWGGLTFWQGTLEVFVPNLRKTTILILTTVFSTN